MKAYIRIDATKPPESISATEIYMTDQGHMEYMFGLKTWYPEEKQNEPEWYLQEISLSDLMIEFANKYYSHNITAIEEGFGKPDIDKLLSKFLTQKGIVIKQDGGVEDAKKA